MASSRFAITAASGLLISWATPAASVPTDAMRSVATRCASVWRSSVVSRTVTIAPSDFARVAQRADPARVPGYVRVVGRHQVDRHRLVTVQGRFERRARECVMAGSHEFEPRVTHEVTVRRSRRGAARKPHRAGFVDAQNGIRSVLQELPRTRLRFHELSLVTDGFAKFRFRRLKPLAQRLDLVRLRLLLPRADGHSDCRSR